MHEGRPIPFSTITAASIKRSAILVTLDTGHGPEMLTLERTRPRSDVLFQFRTNWRARGES